MKGRKALLIIVPAALLAACGQDEITLPPEGGGGGGECGAWYPGGGDAGADGGASYAVKEGSTFGCYVWESARRNGEDTYINTGEIYLAANRGDSGRKSLVIVVGARNCTACKALVEAIAPRKAEFEDKGALMVGLCRSDLTDPGVRLTLDEAEDVLVGGDGWPADWYVTNDAERHLPPELDVLVPWVVVVRLKDMSVRRIANYTKETAGDLLSSLDEL
ncbi:MAG: hypothetical protein PHU25_16875 [Deltaproteobacteria bacterium]|nr:hypothetical protein [Deltaproteobacteria bacterium]